MSPFVLLSILVATAHSRRSRSVQNVAYGGDEQDHDHDIILNDDDGMLDEEDTMDHREMQHNANREYRMEAHQKRMASIDFSSFIPVHDRPDPSSLDADSSSSLDHLQSVDRHRELAVNHQEEHQKRMDASRRRRLLHRGTEL
jgi:hypothetical protein